MSETWHGREVPVPIFDPNAVTAPHEVQICSRCHTRAEFYMDLEPGCLGWVSVCCGWPPLRLDRDD